MGKVVRAVLSNEKTCKCFKHLVFLIETLYGIRIRRFADLTYGKGLFYQELKNVYVIGFDIQKLDWVHIPNEFYELDITDTRAVLDILKDRDIDVVVVDPPWDREKRGPSRIVKERGWDHYRFPADSEELLRSAVQVSKVLGKPLIYKYKEILPETQLAIANKIKIFGSKGFNYYGLIKV